MIFDLYFEGTSVVKPLTRRGKAFYEGRDHTNIRAFVAEAESMGLHLSYRDQELRTWLTEKK
jgi:hypothetical protein